MLRAIAGTPPGLHARGRTLCARHRRPLLRRSAPTAPVVGPLLVAINQDPTLLSGVAAAQLAWQLPRRRCAILRRHLGRIEQHQARLGGLVSREERPVRHWRFGARFWALAGVLALLPLLAACGAASDTGDGLVASGASRAMPVDGHALGGQGRVGTPGQGTFLFFDADG
ncbi:MAG: hypothetical protein M3Q65_17750 [Chloroflexota bacterium]|nr:hypothetical protein [Chloroflexota bacterium]